MAEIALRNAKHSKGPSQMAKRGFRGFVPMAEPPKRTLREMLIAAMERTTSLKKAMEDPGRALERAAEEPIDQRVLLAPYRKAPVFRLH